MSCHSFCLIFALCSAHVPSVLMILVVRQCRCRWWHVLNVTPGNTVHRHLRRQLLARVRDAGADLTWLGATLERGWSVRKLTFWQFTGDTWVRLKLKFLGVLFRQFKVNFVRICRLLLKDRRSDVSEFGRFECTHVWLRKIWGIRLADHRCLSHVEMITSLLLLWLLPLPLLRHNSYSGCRLSSFLKSFGGCWGPYRVMAPSQRVSIWACRHWLGPLLMLWHLELMTC